ncbi:hypothetical protein BDY19DRAFT_962183 [Irpex rosettiformis]|uniref:Uncharacterized protein n=1 Tax=Irpex rosettiformis TaxID=378272 RepID=A0ACB8TWD7_9APHY|nr:hypothetical protein BDY19DRAFT_962183 [Irpex rosettiformis]
MKKTKWQFPEGSSQTDQRPLAPFLDPTPPANKKKEKKEIMAAAVSGSSTSTAGSSTSAPSQPLYAQGNDWTKNLVHLAKTAELKKHALTLQLHTANILCAHASLDHKHKAIQDVKEQKNKLDSERTRLLNCLREVNEDRDKADMLEAKLNEDVNTLRTKIKTLSDGEYATAKADVDRLRQELGQPPLPNLQQTLEEKTQHYLRELRLQTEAATTVSSSSSSTNKRTTGDDGSDGPPAAKRPRGRPKGSKNSKKGKVGDGGGGATTPAPPEVSSIPNMPHHQPIQPAPMPMAPMGYT